MKKIITMFILVLSICGMTGCQNKNADDTVETSSTEETSLWDSAIYKEDTELGNGEKTVSVKVEVLENSVDFTIHTEKDILGDALIENSLIEGEEGEFGIYIKKVNGIVADYDIDQSYWAFYIGDEYATSGVDTTNISEDEEYRLVYTK